MTKKLKAKAAAEPKPSKLFRALSSVFLINSEQFAQQKAPAQTNLLAKAGSLPIKFVANFRALQDKRRIREALLAGQNVDVELEFNGLTLTEEEKAAMVAIRPVLEKIGNLGPVYPWLPEADCSHMFIIKPNNIRREGYTMTKGKAQAYFETASTFWSGGPQPKNGTHSVRDGYYSTNKTVSYHPEAIKIGCQTISRSEVEWLARHLGWEPKPFEG